MIPPEYVAVINPFAPEAKEVVRASPPLDSLSQDIIDRAVERVRWRSGRGMLVDFSPEAIRSEVLSFYLMCQGVAAVSHPYSREVRLVSGATSDVVRYRMYDLFKRGYEHMCLQAVRRSFKLQQLKKCEGGFELPGAKIPQGDYFKIRDKALAEGEVEVVDDRVLDQYLPRYAVRWTDLAPLLRRRRAELTRLYLASGWAVITPRELWDVLADFVAVKAEEYIASLYERFSDAGAPPELFARVGERISSLLPPELELRERFARMPARKLNPESFPPCVRRALLGVEAGARNYAVVMLLTPFLSHARISPSGKASAKISDFVEDISVVRDEIVPMIFEAAERCNPPLFLDQPQERANVYYHLGFGMTTEPRLEDSGKSKWYRTPNCSKVQVSAPQLCDPDEFCRGVKNPLTYYFKRLAEHAGARGGG